MSGSMSKPVMQRGHSVAFENAGMPSRSVSPVGKSSRSPQQSGVGHRTRASGLTKLLLGMDAPMPYGPPLPRAAARVGARCDPEVTPARDGTSNC